jgi:hypothetical protein
VNNKAFIRLARNKTKKTIFKMLNVGFWIFDNPDFFGDYVFSVAVGYPF